MDLDEIAMGLHFATILHEHIPTPGTKTWLNVLLDKGEILENDEQRAKTKGAGLNETNPKFDEDKANKRFVYVGTKPKRGDEGHRAYERVEFSDGWQFSVTSNGKPQAYTKGEARHIKEEGGKIRLARIPYIARTEDRLKRNRKWNNERKGTRVRVFDVENSVAYDKIVSRRSKEPSKSNLGKRYKALESRLGEFTGGTYDFPPSDVIKGRRPYDSYAQELDRRHDQFLRLAKQLYLNLPKEAWNEKFKSVVENASFFLGIKQYTQLPGIFAGDFEIELERAHSWDGAKYNVRDFIESRVPQGTETYAVLYIGERLIDSFKLDKNLVLSPNDFPRSMQYKMDLAFRIGNEWHAIRLHAKLAFGRFSEEDKQRLLAKGNKPSDFGYVILINPITNPSYDFMKK